MYWLGITADPASVICIIPVDAAVQNRGGTVINEETSPPCTGTVRDIIFDDASFDYG